MLELLLWNCGGGPSDEKVGWLRRQPWDVAILLEVSKTGLPRLERPSDGNEWATTSSIPTTTPRRGRRYGVALLTRRSTVMESPVASPQLSGRFDERIWAAKVTHEAIGSFVVAGFHAPNGAKG